MVTEFINKMLGPVCTFIIIGTFTFCILLPLFEILLKKRDEAIADRAVLTIEILQNGEDDDPDPEILEETKGVDVHDHAIQGTLAQSYGKLKEWYGRTEYADDTVDSTIKEIKKEIFKHKDINITEQAYATLRVMQKFNGRLSGINANELNVLNMVWKRINDPVNTSVKQDLVASLIAQLADASMTLEQSRCLSGRVTRIIQSLQAIDAENIIHISSTEDIQREMSDKVPLLLSKNLDIVEPEDLKSIVDRELRKDYVETQLLTEEQYLRIVKDYLDAIE
jgi:hypothetical protein